MPISVASHRSHWRSWRHLASLASGLCLLLSSTLAAQSLPGLTSVGVVPAETASRPADPPEGIWWSGSQVSQEDFENGALWATSSLPQVPLIGSDESSVYSYDATLERDLFQQTDLVLPGIGSVQSVTFTRPRMWKLVEGTELRLNISHSGALLPERSYLTVYINDISIRSIQLNADNLTAGKINIPIPLNLLRDFNQLKLEVQQHYTNDCEDPFDPALWTIVSRQSSFHFAYKLRPVVEDLAFYPLPLFDRQGYGPTVLRFVLPSSASDEGLEALGLVAAGMGREISYAHMALAAPLSSYKGARGHVLMVGTPQELPEIRELLGSALDGLSDGQGLLSLRRNPTNPFAAIIVVTGKDGAGVVKAARELSQSNRNFTNSGVNYVTRSLAEQPVSLSHARADFVPPKEQARFTLKDLGFVDTTVKGFFASPLRIDVRSLPDVQYFDQLQRLRIYYSYGAQLDTRLSTLEVRWNNITVQSVALDQAKGETRAALDVNIPVEIIAPYNSLQFIFHMLPKSYNPCETKVDHQLWGTLFADSTFEMPRYYHAEMPDLSTLQYGFYPYGLKQDLSDTSLVISDSPSQDELMAAMTLAGELGRNTRAEHVAVRLVRGSRAASEAKDKARNMIVISTGQPNQLLKDVQDRRLLVIDGQNRSLRNGSGELLSAVADNTHGVLEQILSPFGGERVITIAHGERPELLKRAIRLITDIRAMSQLAGDIVVVNAEGSLKMDALGEVTSFGAIPLTVRMVKWGRANPPMVVAVLLIALFVLFLILKFALAAYRGTHHKRNDGPDEPPPSHQGGPTPAPGGGSERDSAQADLPDEDDAGAGAEANETDGGGSGRRLGNEFGTSDTTVTGRRPRPGRRARPDDSDED